MAYIFFKFFTIYLCIYVCVSLYEQAGTCRYLQMPEEGVGPPGAGITSDCGLPKVVLGTKLWSSEMALLTSETSSQVHPRSSLEVELSCP